VTCGVELTIASFDLGHDEARTRWIGPQCRGCNRSDGGARGARVANERR
jgi:hypothetical protein